MTPLSVIVCAHNSRPAILGETVRHLRAQTLSVDDWELIVVDNASEPALSPAGLTDWHPRGKLIAEGTLGLTPARLSGIAVAKGEIIVLVDDDNWLEPDYLATIVRLFQDDPALGAVGGQCIGVFEKEPNEWQRSYLWLVVVRTFTEARRTRDLTVREALPAGAGMGIRRSVAESYAAFVATHKEARLLDRRGTDILLQGGDTHIVQCAVALGSEVGTFPELRLRHYMPAGRLALGYLRKLYAGLVASGYVFGYVLHGRVDWPRRDWRWWRRQIWGRIRNFHHQASFLQAEIDGEREARRLLAELEPKG